MSREPCKCCDDKKSGAHGGRTGYGFNRLNGEEREWAKNNKFALSEYCVHVKDGKKFSGPEWLKIKCGDGRMGFSTRRKGQDEVRMETGPDEQVRRKRHTLVRTRSARATATRRARRVDGSKVRLVSSETIMEAQRDPIMVAQQSKVDRKIKRARNRNNRARRGYKKMAA